MTALSLLLVDDDLEYSRLLGQVLEQAGLGVFLCGDGKCALQEVAKRRFDLILLDVTMPAMDGFQVLHQLRRLSDTPVIMLTSRIASADKVQGLDGGADDYLCKPCDPDELLSRIRAVLRRTQTAGGALAHSYAIGTHRFEMRTRQLLCHGSPVKLTSLEGELLFVLLQARGMTVQRDALSLALQKREPDVLDRSLDVHISRLRAKLGADAGAIQTVRGMGYRLAGAVEELSAP
jgi:DNA-binding response OmpR family regulator